MCGIWGVFNHDSSKWLAQNDIKIAKTLFTVSHSRGDHSAGVCMVERVTPNGYASGEPRTIKCVGSMYNIFHTKDGHDAWQTGSNMAHSIFGHTRYATRGAIKASNAHPFTEGDWVMVHNGTLTGGFELSAEVEVDSHALCKKIDEMGIKDALLSITGAFAIIAYNKKTKQLYITRNGDRPLHYFYHDGVTYVSSEALDVEYALRKNNSYHYTPKIEPSTVQQFEEHRLYVLTENGFEDIDSVKPKTKPAPLPITYQYPTHKGSVAEFIKPTEGETVEFWVEQIVPTGRSFKYEGRTLSDDLVYFYSGERDDLLIGQCGTALVHQKIFRKTLNMTEYHILKRQVKWEEDEIVEPETLKGCLDCGEPIEESTQYVKTSDNKYICEKCVAYFKQTTNQSFLKAYIDEDRVC